MAVPYIALTLAQRLAAGYFNKSVGGSMLAGVAGFLGWDNRDAIQKTLFGSAPSGLNTTTPAVLQKPPALPKAPPAPVAPSIPNTNTKPALTNALTPSLDAYQRSIGNSILTGNSIAAEFELAKTQSDAKKAELEAMAGASPFLLTLARGASATSDVSDAINAQSAVLVTMYESLERNLSLLASVAVASLQNTYEQAAENTAALVTVTDRLKPFEDNQVFQKTSVAVKDINGVEVTHAEPRAVALAKNAALAKGEADTNSIGGDLMDGLSDIFDGDATKLLKIFSYFPVTASTSALGTNDDFEAKLNAWRTAQ